MYSTQERNRPLLQINHQNSWKERECHHIRRLHEAFLQLAPAQQSMSTVDTGLDTETWYYVAYLASGSGEYSHREEISRVGSCWRTIAAFSRCGGNLYGFSGRLTLFLVSQKVGLGLWNTKNCQRNRRRNWRGWGHYSTELQANAPCKVIFLNELYIF